MVQLEVRAVLAVPVPLVVRAAAALARLGNRAERAVRVALVEPGVLVVQEGQGLAELRGLLAGPVVQVVQVLRAPLVRR